MSWPSMGSYTQYRETLFDSPSANLTDAVCYLFVRQTDTYPIPKTDIDSKRYQLHDSAGNVLDYEQRIYIDGPTSANILIAFRMPNLYASPSGDQNKVRLVFGYDPGTDQDDPTAVYTAGAGAIAILPLDESGNGTANEFVDRSGNAHHGRGGNGDSSKCPTQHLTDYKLVASQDCDGTDDFINIASHSDFDNQTAATWMIWAKNDDEGDTGNPVLIRNFDGTEYGPQAFYDSNDIRTRWDASSAYDIVDGPDKASFAYDSWFHYAMTYDSATQELKAYFNGEQVGGTQTTSGTSCAVSGATVYLAGYAATLNWDGHIEEFQVWGDAKPEAWINWHYHNVADADHAQTHSEIVEIGDGNPWAIYAQQC